MDRKVWINNYPIQTRNFKKEAADRIKVSFTFMVTHKDYHDVTTLLYENDFIVKVPDEGLEFYAKISKYSTSVADLYKEGAEGEFKLELTEIEKEIG